MKLLFLLMVASLSLPTLIDAGIFSGDSAIFQSYDFEPADSYFGVVHDGMRRTSRGPPPYKLNARLLATSKKKSPPPPAKKAAAAKPAAKPSRNSGRWDNFYMNNWTPADPPGGLVISDDQLHVDMKITSPSQIFGHFLTKDRFLYGYFSIYMKLIPKDSAGCIMTYYFSSPENHVYDANGNDMDTHDEMDFEFLGNTTGNPTTLQTNLYLNGKGNREKRHNLPFDPAKDFHKYSLLWNEHMIIWYVDDSVIRVHYNKGGVPFPIWRPMAAQASLWNGSAWATQGGKIKLDITHAPFLLQYEGFGGIEACAACPTNQFSDPSPNCTMSAKSPAVAKCKGANWWNKQKVLTSAQITQLKAHTKKYIIYNYCYDEARFGGKKNIPRECKNNEYK